MRVHTSNVRVYVHIVKVYVQIFQCFLFTCIKKNLWRSPLSKILTGEKFLNMLWQHRGVESISTTHYIYSWLVPQCFAADLVMRYSSLQETECGPELSLMPYSSITGMFRLMKYSKVSLLMGAAPVELILQRSNPSAARTFLKTRLLASAKPHGTTVCL